MRKNRFLIAVIFAILLGVILRLPDAFSQRVKGGVRETVAPIQEGLSRFWRGLQDAIASLRGFGQITGDNARLSAEVASLRTELEALRYVSEENTRLRAQLGFRQRAPRQLIAAEVIAREPEGWWQTLRLNKGAAEGVRPAMAVISPEGLIGRTEEVSSHTTEVLLISDPACKVSVLIPRNSAFGILSGRGPSRGGDTLCRIEFINKNADIRVGDEVVTSGLGGVYPKGLVIGYVERLYVDASGLYHNADVVSRARIGQMYSAFVVNGATPQDLYPAATNTVRRAP